MALAISLCYFLSLLLPINARSPLHVGRRAEARIKVPGDFLEQLAFTPSSANLSHAEPLVPPNKNTASMSLIYILI